MTAPSTVYLDALAAPPVAEPVIDTMARWMNRGDPAAAHAAGRESRRMIERLRREIAEACGFDLVGPRGYSVVFTGGAAAANCMILTAAARAYAARTGKMPHVVVGAADHPSVIECGRRLAADQMAHLTVVPVQTAGPAAGTVHHDALYKALRPNTCIVSVVAVNHETGAISDLRALGREAHLKRIPFHADAAQLFGRSALRPAELNLDAFSLSFRKFGGPPGVGALVVRNDFVSGYGLACDPWASANVPGLAASLAAFRLATADRGAKNAQAARLRDAIAAGLAKAFLAVGLDEYREARPLVPDGNPMTPRSSRVPGTPKTPAGIELAGKLDAAADADAPVVVWLGPGDRAKTIPHALCFAVLRPDFSAAKARAALEGRGVVVGVLPDRTALAPLDVPVELWDGVFRVGIPDGAGPDDAEAFVAAFAAVAASKKAVERHG